MNPVALSAISLVLILAGAAVGALLRHRLPEHHLDSDSRDVVRLGAGLIGTIAALVLGLLIASAKTSFDTQNNQVTQMSADLILLDELLAQYGPETRPVRELVRASIEPMVAGIWRKGGPQSAGVPFRFSSVGEATYRKLLELAPQNDTQRALKARAIETTIEVARARLLLFEQAGTSLPMPFLAVLVCWLTLIFASFSLFSRLNPTLIGAVVVFALSAVAAIYLVLELNQPFSGLLEISSTPVRNALAPL